MRTVSIFMATAIAIAAFHGVGEAEPATPIVQPAWEPFVNASMYVPDRAVRNGVSGWARVRCSVDDNLRAQGCIVVGEYPIGYGFGKAASNLARIGRLQPSTRGEPVVGRVIISKFAFNVGSIPPSSWSLEPSAVDIMKAKPRGSEDFGMADIACKTTLTDGALRDCSIQSESPAGEGFGDAALGLSGRYRSSVLVAPVLKVSFWVNWIEQASSLVPPGYEVGRSPTPQAIVSVHDPLQPGGIVRLRSEIFVDTPSDSQIESVRPNGAVSPASVSMTCEVSSLGAMENCSGSLYRTTDARYLSAAKSLLPYYRYSPSEIKLFEAEPRAVYHVNWETPRR